MIRIDYFINWCVLLSSIWPGFFPIGQIEFGGAELFNFSQSSIWLMVILKGSICESGWKSWKQLQNMAYVLEVLDVAFVSTIYWNWAESCCFESIRKLLLLSSPSSRHYNWCLNLATVFVYSVQFVLVSLWTLVLIVLGNNYHPTVHCFTIYESVKITRTLHPEYTFSEFGKWHN